MKVNLLLDMVGQLLVQSHPRPRATSIRFNTLGGVWKGTTPNPQLGDQGVLEVYLRDCIAEPLRLVGRIAAIAPDGRIKAKFIAPGEHIADLMEKLAFRKHRRQVAGAKHPISANVFRRQMACFCANGLLRRLLQSLLQTGCRPF